MSQEIQNQKQKESHDRKKKKTVIRSCELHDEQAAGFIDLQTGEFTVVMRIRNNKDLDEFLIKYDISIAEIAKE